ncbi:hypothetical protein [Cytobacillus purgationiresistens]|uniref:Uncharacterized membrane protein YjgN (DUF898 family) n=1 Tax=Cytobacillus purgationiresistens TaxID=863449 RepID=A0ABU0ABU6_9BACI|nr:hypothetical protein [Cytobacillus purgationiresistens]MDQ0268191.1 uncharacterized membrane protein YjgN (DUF898 family) [Cytobacillus purgationiresistens]
MRKTCIHPWTEVWEKRYKAEKLVLEQIYQDELERLIPNPKN